MDIKEADYLFSYPNGSAWSIPSYSLFFGFGTAWLHCFVAVTLVVYKVHEKLIHSTNPGEHYFFSFCFALFFPFLPWISKLNYLIVWWVPEQVHRTGTAVSSQEERKTHFPSSKDIFHLLYCPVALSPGPLQATAVRQEVGYVLMQENKILRYFC